MRLSRAALPVVGVILTLAAGCTSDATTSPGPEQHAQSADTDAPITQEGNATVYRGHAATIAADARAREWAAKGDTRLAAYLASQREPARQPDADGVSRRFGPIGTQPNLIISTVEPDPQTMPNAYIYSSGTQAFVNGGQGTVVSSVIYFGNIAYTDQTFGVTDLKGAVVFPERTVTNRGEGDRYPCMGSSIQCSFTFKFVTTSNVSLGNYCDRILGARASHRVEWFVGATKLIGALTWGTAFGNDAQVFNNNGACPPPPPPPPPTPPAGGGSGSTPPDAQTPPPEPPTYTPPYYSPKPGQWNCIVHFGGTDYEYQECHWVENNDTRIATGGTTNSSFAGAGDSPSFTSGDKLPSVFVIVSDAVPAGSMAVVERHKEGKYKNVLLVPSQNFRPAELVRAMRYVYASLAANAETPKELSAQLKGSVADAEVSSAERDYAATFTTMLSKSKSGDAGAYGVRPFLEIQLGPAKK